MRNTFSRNFTIDEATFQVRGLTVGEYCELFYSKQVEFTQIKQSFFVKIGMMCVIDWEDVFATDGGEYVTDEHGSRVRIPYSEDMVQFLPEIVLMELGKFSWTEMTQISEEEISKFKAYIRFIDYMSDKEYDSDTKTFNCEDCVKLGKYGVRKCGKTQEEINQIYIGATSGHENDIMTEPDIVKSAELAAQKTERKNKLLNKLSVKKKKKKMYRDTPDPKKVEEKKSSKLKLKGYEYPECPISYLDDWIRVIGEKMLYCDKNGITFFEGGLSDQPKKLYDIARITSSELSKIESEMYEKSRSDK